MKGKMDCYGLTHVGQKRANNEDQFLIADLSKSMRVHQSSLGIDDQTRLFGNSQGILLLVADGMGGQAAGERASQIALNSLTSNLLNTMHWFLRLDEQGEDDFLESLKAALEKCQVDILAEAQSTPERRGMGTTLTMAYIIWPRLYVVHAGDSRCYLLRGDQLRQITTDHNMAQQLVEQGALKPAEAESSRWSNVLYKVVGGSGDRVNPEVHRAELVLGDRLLLCTDGLTKHVADDRILETLSGQQSSGEACQGLVDAANQAGGSDNITVVVAQFQERNEQDDLQASEAEHAEPSRQPMTVADLIPANANASR